MSQLSPTSPLGVVDHPSYARIEDRLDEMGQKYRIYLILRGAIVFQGVAVGLTLAASLLANSAGSGRVSVLILVCWIAILVAAACVWLVRPLFSHPKPLHVARLIESRVSGLHNGLVNSVQLAEASDLQSNPWLGAIYEEVAAGLERQPIGSAVRWSGLKGTAYWSAGVTCLAAVVALLAPLAVAHGFRQMLAPNAFVPVVGRVTILEVRPGNVTLVAGQPLEISVTADDTSGASAQLYVEAPGTAPQSFPLSPGARPAAESYAAKPVAHFDHRIEHVDTSMRYRVEVGGTQSRWFDVTVVKQINLEQLTLQLFPPAYLSPKVPQRTLQLEAPDLAQTPVVMPQGTRIDLAAVVDVPVASGLLQLGDATPQPMERGMDTGSAGRRFAGTTVAMADLPVSILLTQAGGQIVAKIPDPPLTIKVTPDAPPTITPTSPSANPAYMPVSAPKIAATLRDDIGLKSARLLLSTEASETGQDPQSSMKVVDEKIFTGDPASAEYAVTLDDKILKSEFRTHGRSIRMQFEATDNRDLRAARVGGSTDDLGPQTTRSPIYEIRFRDPEVLAKEQQAQAEELRAELLELLKLQQSLHTRTTAFKPADLPLMTQVHAGQSDLVARMRRVVDTFAFGPDDKVVQKTLLMLIANPAGEAVEIAASIGVEPVEKERAKLSSELQSRQRRIIDTLQSLLTLLGKPSAPTTEPTSKPVDDVLAKAEAYKKLVEDLKTYQAEQRRILDQTAPLAKKPVDDWDDKDKKLMDELAMSQEKLDAFMQQKVNDMSKLAEQDMSNASLLQEIMEVYAEVTMAKDALNKQAVTIAVPAEEAGLELAQSITSNLEKWLATAPDREKWEMDDPKGLPDIPMAELPKELEDLVGELMENQEDLFQEMEDAETNYADSLDKGAGWGAADGPIANMSAKGVTGNVLPNDNNMNGRSGEGRSGKSQGEFVEETATGKGGRNTPTRLDPTPFQKGQVTDTSKDPVGGATGGGKVSGQGGEGLEGSVPPKSLQEQMQRLAQKQAEIRNTAERLNLQHQLGRYDNFKLLQSITMMRRVESDLNANRYQNAMYRKDVTLDSLDTSRLLLGGQLSVAHDTTPTGNHKIDQDINDAMKGSLPPAWSGPLKEYYRKLGEQ